MIKSVKHLVITDNRYTIWNSIWKPEYHDIRRVVRTAIKQNIYESSYVIIRDRYDLS